MSSSTLSLTSALDEGKGGQRRSPAALPPGEIINTHSTGGFVGPRAAQDGSDKPRPPRDLIPGPSRSSESTI
jgi:hypothetical protein